jgi:hypothetical protein
VTAETEQNAASAQSVAMAESQAAAHAAHAQAMHRQVTGSGTDTSDSTRSPTDTAVQWSQPHGIVSGPTPDNSGENRSPNVGSPTDNSQSQPR